MTIEEMRRVHSARPFTPFTVYLAEGRRLKVKHPEYMAISPSARIVHIVGDDGGIESIDLLMVVSLERGGSKRRPPSNGNGRH